jgi:predicted nucleotidyltransferase component of viral defense system
MRKTKITQYQQEVLKTLSGRINEFYLAGGTALSLFYFQHRISIDLDFFTPKLSYKGVKETIVYLQKSLKCEEIKLVAQNLQTAKTKMLIYNIHFRADDILKVDFVEDVFELIQETKTLEGIKILSLEDIYLRKIFAICGVIKTIDKVGKAQFIGQRVAAKDLYDLYFLSHVFMPLSQFAEKYCDATMQEALIRWFKTYDRMAMIDGMLQIETDKNIDTKSIEKHFAKEITQLIEQQIGEI